MSTQGTEHSSNAAHERRNLLGDLLVRETTHLKQSIAARIWKFDLARDYEAVTELTQEVLQEVAVRAWAQADKYDPGLSGHAWLDRIALNVLYEQRRRIYAERKRGIAIDAMPVADSESQGNNLPELPDSGGFDQAEVQELLELVPPADRRLLQAHYVLNLSPKEIAVELNLSLGAVYTGLSRARTKLRAAINEINQTGKER